MESSRLEAIRRLTRVAIAPASLLCLLVGASAEATEPQAPTASGAARAAAAPPAWVEKSNAHALVLLDVMARLVPEQAGFFGMQGLDEQITEFKPGFEQRAKEAIEQAIATLEQREAAERDPDVRQDLSILIARARQQAEGRELFERMVLPYFDLNGLVFQGIRVLLDDQVPADRRAAALVRLRRYAGLDAGYEPIARLAESHIREKLADSRLLGPSKAEVERDLANNAAMIEGVEKLFVQYQLEGYEKPCRALERQLADYERFVRSEILPRARSDFRLPPELYAMSLREVGVDMPIEELVSRANVAFREIQNEMQTLAPLVAKEQGFAASDYRDVIRELKKRQVTGDAILLLYQRRIQDLERIIRDAQIVTLPERAMRIQLASEAESATIPAPNMRPPRLIGNTGEMGTFVLPLRIPGRSGQMDLDDFTFEAASWTLTAHEGRPGHELQFASIIEKGVSIARALFAFNSVNAEGWGLYAEAEAKPYEPLDGQLVALQQRLVRAARAILDPGLQAGTISPEEALRVLQDDVVLSPAMAQQEVERYTVRSPGQAVSYFCGYQRLMDLRAEVERKLGRRFDRKRYHDFVLAQGLLPPALLRQAVMERFVPDPNQSAGN